MSITSDWPLPPKGIRFLIPQLMIEQMALHPLTQGLYPIATGYYPIARQHCMQREHHDSYLLIYCTAGKASLMTDNKDYRIGSGDLVLLPKGCPHAYQADPEDPWSIFWIHLGGNRADAFYQHIMNKSSSPLTIGVQSCMVQVFNSLLELRSSGYDMPSLILSCHQIQVMLSHTALLVRQECPKRGRAIDWEQVRVFMQEHIHTQLNLDALAAKVKLSKYHFSKKFNAHTGQSPIQSFINMKMQRACFLLESSSRSVKQVSGAMGYEDAYYFSRLFKKVIGLSPDQYRKSRHR